MKTKKEILEANLSEWLKCSGDRVKRGEMINSISSALHIHKKSVSRSFRNIQLKVKRKSGAGRSEIYGADVRSAFYDIWKVMNYACAENTHGEELVNNLDNLIKNDHWSHDEYVTFLLRGMSLSTTKRMISKLRIKYDMGKGLSTTVRSPLHSMIPVFKGPWHNLPVGNGQIDTVAHCGGDIKGDYMFTVNYTDANVYWVGLCAQWCKGEKATLLSLESIRLSLPFELKHIHPDSGTEFINYALKKWAEDHSIRMTRSEPSKSNDNMYVEERNGHVVRKYLGYVRYDKIESLNEINEYYKTLSLYLNYFMPVRRITSKIRVDFKTIRKYEKCGLSPYSRMLNNPDVSKEAKDKLTSIYEKLDLYTLKRKLDTMRSNINKKNR